MDKFILWSIISYGMTTILVYGKIFNTPRKQINNLSKKKYRNKILNIIPNTFKFIDTLINCVLCTSTWVGFFLSFVLFSPTKEYFGVNFFNFFFDGVLSAGIVWCINSIIEFFEENRIK
jgi:hypothetical protein